MRRKNRKIEALLLAFTLLVTRYGYEGSGIFVNADQKENTTAVTQQEENQAAFDVMKAASPEETKSSELTEQQPILVATTPEITPEITPETTPEIPPEETKYFTVEVPAISLIDGVELGASVIRVIGTKTGETSIVKEQALTGNTSVTFDVEWKQGYVYTYAIDFENYTDVQEQEIIPTADGKIQIPVSSMQPDYGIVEPVRGNKQVKVLAETVYQVTVKDVWEHRVNWSVTDKDAGAVIDGSATGSQCTVLTSQEGAYGIKAALTDGTVLLEQEVTVEKLETTLSVTAPKPAWWSSGVDVTATLTDELGNFVQGREVTIKVTRKNGKSEEKSGITNADGKVTLHFILIKWGEYTLEASFSGDSVYKAPATATGTYNPDRDKVNLKTDEKSVTYGTQSTEYKFELTTEKGNVIDGETIEGTVGITGAHAKVFVHTDPTTKEHIMQITPLKAGTEILNLTFNTENYTFIQKVTVTVNPYPLTVDLSQIQTGKENANLWTNEKVYDGSSKVSLHAPLVKTEEELKDLSEEKKAELTGVDEIVIPSFDSKIKNVKGEEKEQTFIAEFDLKKSTLKDNEIFENYTLKDKDGENPQAEAKITIKRAVLTLTVKDNERNYREKNYKYNLDTLVSAEGYVAGEKEKIEKNKNFRFPKVKDTTFSEQGEDLSWYLENKDVLILDQDDTSYNATGNYKFNLVNYKKGTLTVNPENNGAQYVSINNNTSSNVYQNEEKTKIYVGNAVAENLPATAVFQLEGGYNAICESGKTVNLVNGMALDTTEERDVKKNVYLCTLEEDGKIRNRTKDFDLTFLYDGTAPKCNKISFSTSDKVIADLASAITFGLYSNVPVEASVELSDGESGIKNWSYCVVDVEKDQTYEKLQPKTAEEFGELLQYKPFTDPKENTNTIPVGALNKDQTLAECNNYIVFVKAEDQVGNAHIYGSNGVVLENSHDITITYSERSDAEVHSDGEKNHYNQDVTLNLLATESGKIFSGIHKLEYQAEMVNGDGKTESDEQTTTIYQEDSKGKEKWIPSDVSLEKLKKYTSLGTERLFEIVPSQSKKITVTSKAKDFAGNETEEAVRTFVIDPVVPEVISQISQENNKGAFTHTKYANSDVTYEVTVQERYLNTLTVNLNGTEYTLDELESQKDVLGISIEREELPDQNKTTDASEYHFSICFQKDGDYTVQTTVTDFAGNTGNDDTHIFVRDTVKPELSLTYTAYLKNGQTKSWNSPVLTRAYANEEVEYIQIIAKIIEKNFTTEGLEQIDGSVQVTAENVNGKTDTKAWNEAFVKLDDNWMNTGFVEEITDERSVWVKTLPPIQVDANYTFSYDYMDLAGNSLQESVTDRITLDREKPHGTVQVDQLVNGNSVMTWIDRLAGNITFGVFGQHTVGAILDSNDVTSGISKVQYMASSEVMNRSQLASHTDWKEYGRKLTFSANQNLVIYEKVTDIAGNTEYYSSDGIIVDSTKPVPVITVTPSTPAWGKGVYSASDAPGFDIVVEDPVKNNSYAGLRDITYRIVNGTDGTVEERTIASFAKADHRQKWTGHVVVDPAKFYSNDVQITVSARDWSTNEVTSETTVMKIDNKAPIVRFSFDKSDVQNGKYYKNNKALTITVDERNFDSSYIPTVTSTAGGGYSFSGWSSVGEIHTGTVTFSGDSDYTVTYDCYDLAGNKSNTERLEEFTVDKTNPVMTVTYDNNSSRNGEYYKESRTATISVTEHNFDGSKMQISANGLTGTAPSISGWSSSGDRHTATVNFSRDGEYTLSVSGMDLASNVVQEYGQDKFVVDLTKPEIEITGVDDKKAYNGDVLPAIKVTDTNFSSKDVEITLTGAVKGEIDLSSMVQITSAGNGRNYVFQNFGAGMDDIYTLKVTSVDQAGNEEVDSRVFSVNRDGSNYVLNDATKKLIEQKYTNTPEDLVIEEINVNSLELVEITYSKDGEVVTLQEGKDFILKEEGGEGEWKKYTYTILAQCFEEEGTYVINIYSEDGAGNTTTNKGKAKTIEFTVDKTAPTIVVTNLVDEGRYQENIHQFTLDVKDNLALSYVEMYLDGELIHTYEGEELTRENGVIYIELGEKNTYQKVELVAYDVAGNVTKDAYVSDKEGEEKTTKAVFNVLVTANAWVQYYMNKPLFYGSIVGILVFIAVIIYLIKKYHDKK